MLYNDATIKSAEVKFYLHMPKTRGVSGILQHGQTILAGDNLQEILRECRKENNYKEGHYVTDLNWKEYHA